MKISRRVVSIILFGSIILLMGMLFSSFILKNIIEPTSLAIWVLLRIFVLSIDQKYYWGTIIFVAAIFLFRFLPQGQTVVQPEYFPDSNATIKSIEYWRIVLTFTADNIHDEETLKRELIHLLLSLYASKQRISTNFILYEALKRGELPLPEDIHEFLFPDNSKKSKRAFDKFIQSIRSAPRKWMRRWSGQETAEHYRMINETLGFIEKSMEIKNDDGKFTPDKY
jgi:hypothetical protein